jgi:phosphotransferase system enzyme I (PtsP)
MAATGSPRWSWEEASPTSHICHRGALAQYPIGGRIEGVADAARARDPIVVDAETGEVHLRPLNEIVTAFQAKQALLAQRVARFAAIRDEPAVTRDGVRVSLHMNAGLLLDLPHLAQSGADGIGLFRTELQFMIGSNMPRLADQIAFYSQVLDAAGDRPVVFRTLDLGGDKVPTYGRAVREENPALGWRALRIALDRPALLRYQVRALISAADGRCLRLLLPHGERGLRIRSSKGTDQPRTRARAEGWRSVPSSIKLGRDGGSAVTPVRARSDHAGGRVLFPSVRTTFCNSCLQPIGPIPQWRAAMTRYRPLC